MAVTIHDIARELDLSAMTVSRVLNRPESSSIAPATKERVLKAAASMGYRPNRHAKALVTKRLNTVALWIDHLHSSVYSQIAHACREEIQRAGLQLEICEMDWHFGKPESQRRFEWMVDGVIAVDPPEASALAALMANAPLDHIPRVNLGSAVSVAWEGDYVRVDLQLGARVAIEHLLGQGCRRIAYVVPAGLDRSGVGNYDAYTDTMRAAGKVPEYIVLEDLSLPAVRDAARRYVQGHGQPDGVFCHYDELTIAVFRALRDLNLRVPQDVLIVGCEGNEFMEYFDPPLSTVAMPARELVRIAWELLQNRMEHPEAEPKGVLVPHQFHLRQSAIAPR
ncbi:LacI family transcriptional regulator [Capsulimonas corticalis]|uniref:LacI family transcriptional regulator n=1 Tax=Capsulimonas corticalis TaxID=2219043 RepID=A0A402D686_9BACT|nr:LacI family DNA-binding transcriptional regulator [Capsulimonas corticalis]BDI32051.1 LacI family transcriptional regulator [Capsulimonas corticalis]